jgi:ATP-binding cassette, subfamily B, bacterial
MLKNNSFLEGGRVLLRAMRLSMDAAPQHFFWLTVMVLLQGFAVPAGVWLSKITVDRVLGNGQEGLVVIAALWGISLLLTTLLDPWISLTMGALNEKVTAAFNLKLMQKINSLPDLQVFEEAEFYNQLELVRQEARTRPLNLMVSVITLLRQGITILGLLLLLVGVAWWIPLLLVLTVYPQITQAMQLQRQSWESLLGGQLETRQMRYYQNATTDKSNAKELRIFGFGHYLEERYRQVAEAFHARMNKNRWRLALSPIGLSLLAVVGNVAAFIYVVMRAQQGSLSAGDVLLLLQTLSGLGPRLGEFSAISSIMSEHLSFFRQFFTLMQLQPQIRADGTLALPAQPTSIHFEDVAFRYPDGRLALENISFSIDPGERIAIVGENGAGKTTLIKLLTRLYDPSSGSIRLGQQPLQDYDLAAWRANMAAVFQDFGQYQLSLAENVQLGNLAASATELTAALAFAEFDLAGLPGGSATLLGKPFGGTELSGGQWQKLAIARAALRPAPLLILDEPTAALDPRAEFAVFERFGQMARDKTVIFVTHRLASISHADRVLVLKNGRLVESGSHQQLMQLGGEYAELYRLQASQYQD